MGEEDCWYLNHVRRGDQLLGRCKSKSSHSQLLPPLNQSFKHSEIFKKKKEKKEEEEGGGGGKNEMEKKESKKEVQSTEA